MGQHEHFGQNDTRIRQALDYDDSAAPAEGQAILWVASGGKFTPRTITPAGIGAATSGHTHAAYAPTASPTFTGTVTLPGNPGAALEAAPRQYVDSQLGFDPSDHGLSAWPFDPILATGTFQPSADGLLFAAAVPVGKAFTTVAVSFVIATAGATLTSGRNYLGLYDSSGSLIAQTADQSTNWTAVGTQGRTWASSVALTPGMYYVGGIAAGTTRPAFAAAPSSAGALQAAITGRSNATARGGTVAGAYTALPATKPTPTALIAPPWFALV